MPTAFVLTSTHPQTMQQLDDTRADSNKVSFESIAVPGIEGKRAPGLQGQDIWRRAQVAWALQGLPYIQKRINYSEDKVDLSKRQWIALAEESCKPFSHINMAKFEQVIDNAPPVVEILQVGCR